MLFDVEKPKLEYEEYRMFKKKDLAIAIALAMSVSQVGFSQTEEAPAPVAEVPVAEVPVAAEAAGTDTVNR